MTRLTLCSRKLNELDRHVVHQPDAIGGTMKHMARPMPEDQAEQFAYASSRLVFVYPDIQLRDRCSTK
jgi:hypothetical protein